MIVSNQNQKDCLVTVDISLYNCLVTVDISLYIEAFVWFLIFSHCVLTDIVGQSDEFWTEKKPGWCHCRWGAKQICSTVFAAWWSRGNILSGYVKLSKACKW